MRGRKLRWLLALAGLTLAVATALWRRTEPSPPVPPSLPSPVTALNFVRVKDGMTLAEVTAILGPPGDYTSAATTVDDGAPAAQFLVFRKEGVRLHDTELWRTDTAHAFVDFDRAGLAFRGCYTPMRKVSASPIPDNSQWAKVVWKVKELWHRWFS
jgi:hypothetical protein